MKREFRCEGKEIKEVVTTMTEQEMELMADAIAVLVSNVLRGENENLTSEQVGVLIDFSTEGYYKAIEDMKGERK